MKINKTITRAVLIMAAMVSAASATSTYNQGNLLLSFHATSGTGSNYDYVVNLGASSNYTSGTAFSTNIGADLQAIYGDGWYSQTDTNVTWAVVGSASTTEAFGNDAAATVYYSATASQAFSANGQRTASGHIVSYATNSAGYSTSIPSPTGPGNYNLQSSLAQVIASNANYSFTYYASGGKISPNTVDFGLFANIEGAPNSTLNLYRDGSTSGSSNQSALLGTFTLSSTGTLTFTPTAVPEPSAALLGGLGTLLLFTRRRKA